MNALIEPRTDDDDTEERVDEIAALGVDKEDDMLEDLLANGDDEPNTQGTAADSSIGSQRWAVPRVVALVIVLMKNPKG